MSNHKIHVGQRVIDSDGAEGVVLAIEEYPFSKAVAQVKYQVDHYEPSRYVYADSLIPAPLDEPKPKLATSGDRVRHTAKVNPAHRRTDGTAIGSPISNGTSINVLWPGGVYRAELFSQLEVTHPAKTEDNSTTVGQALELLRGEYRTATGKIEELQAYKDSLGVAIDALVEVVVR